MRSIACRIKTLVAKLPLAIVATVATEASQAQTSGQEVSAGTEIQYPFVYPFWEI
jgi:hypothetical protein